MDGGTGADGNTRGGTLEAGFVGSLGQAARREGV